MKYTVFLFSVIFFMGCSPKTVEMMPVFHAVEHNNNHISEKGELEGPTVEKDVPKKPHCKYTNKGNYVLEECQEEQMHHWFKSNKHLFVLLVAVTIGTSIFAGWQIKKAVE